MRLIPLPLRYPCLAVLLACSAVAQRAPIRGAVQLEDGTPWVGATVVLLHRPVPADERYGVEDRVVATTDEAGRFEVEVAVGRRYSVWATSRTDAGLHLGSHVTEGFTFGQPLELRAIGGPRPPARIRVTGLRSWRSLGQEDPDIEIRAITSSRTIDLHRLELGPDSEVELPPLPGHEARVEVLWNGAPLLSWPRPVRFDSERPTTIRLNAPRPTRIDVVDADDGTPIEGLDLLLGAIDTATNERDAYAALATSDATGRIVVPLPIGTRRKFSWHNYPIALRGAGWAPLQWIQTLDVAADHDGTRDDAIAVVKVSPSVTWRRRITSGGVPLAYLPLRVKAQCSAVNATHDSRQTVFLHDGTDEDGRAAVDLPPGREFGITAFPAAADLRAYEQPSWPLHASVLLAAGRAEAGAEAALDLADLVAVNVQVLDPSGAPAQGAQLAIGHAGDGSRSSGALRDIGCNHAGRVRLLLPRMPGLELAAWTPNGWATTTLDTRVATAESPEIRLELSAVEQLSCVLLDPEGKPANTDHLSLHYAPESGDRTLAWGISPVLLYPGADGGFSLPLFPGMEVSLRRSSGSGGYHSLDVELRTDAPPADRLEIEVRR